MSYQLKRLEVALNGTRLSTRLAVLLGAVVVLMSTASAFSVYHLFRANEVVKQLTTHEWESMRTSAAWKASVESRIMHIQVLARLGVGDYAEKLKKDLVSVSKEAESLQVTLERALSDTEERHALAQTTTTKNRFDELEGQLAELNRAGDYDKLTPILEGDFATVSNEYIKTIQGIESQVRERVGAQALAAQAKSKSASLLAGSLVLLSILVAVAMGFWLSRSISRSMGTMVDRARTVASGDLSHDVHVQEGGEIGALERAMADMQGSLKLMVQEVRQSVDNITVASAEIATGNMDLSMRTEQSAGSLEAAVSSIGTLSQAVRETASSAQEANNLADSAKSLAGKGGVVMAEVTKKMAQIRQSSSRITEITGVIDAIAHQTNILALNAAVEAASAGEKGRGFAVVAGEVRSLAMRSAEAAKEIKSLIQASVSNVEQGSELVADAGRTSSEIVTAVERVSAVSTEIRAATAAQNQDIGAVSSLLREVERMTQQNAALVEQSAAAAGSLKDQAQRLSQMVSRFRLSRDECTSAARV